MTAYFLVVKNDNVAFDGKKVIEPIICKDLKAVAGIFEKVKHALVVVKVKLSEDQSLEKYEKQDQLGRKYFALEDIGNGKGFIFNDELYQKVENAESNRPSKMVFPGIDKAEVLGALSTQYMTGAFFHSNPLESQASAKQFLQTKPSENTDKLYAEVAYKYRETLMKEVNPDYLAIACLRNTEAAMCILKSRLTSLINDELLVKIYYQHRHDKKFLAHIIDLKNINLSVSLFYLVEKTPRLIEEIKKSNTLLLIFMFQYKQMINHANNSNVKSVLPPELRYQVKAFKEESIDPFALLGINKEAGNNTINKAFKIAARDNHPDKKPLAEKEQAEEKFKLIKQAHEILQNTMARNLFKKN